MGRARRRGGAGDLARGVLERPSRASSSTCTAAPARPASTRSSPTATSQAAGRYTIVGNLLPSDADGQRDQFVRRLAAHDAGMDLLGMDVTWTAEFAEAGWIRELTGEQKAAADQGHPPAADRHGHVEGQALRHPAAPRTCSCCGTASRSCPTPPKTFDEMMQMAQQLKDAGQALRDRVHRRPVRGLRGEHQQPGHGFGGTLVNEDSTAPTIDDKTVQALTLLHKLATSGLTSSSLSNAQEPEVFADLQNGRSAFSLNWPYVLSRHAGGRTRTWCDDLGYAPYPSVDAGRAAEGDARRDELRDQHLQQAPGRGVRRGDVPAQRRRTQLQRAHRRR